MRSQAHLFSLDPHAHYLNCAYKSPLLRAAEEASIKALRRERDPFKLSPDDFFDEVQEVRERFGRIVNCSVNNVALIPSTSYGFASVLNNIEGKPGGKAVTIGNEFPSGHFAMKRWCEENGNEQVVVQPEAGRTKVGEKWNDDIVASIDDHTVLVLLSSVHWMTGMKFDLKRIGEKCKQVGARFIVDGTQSVGALPMNVMECHIDALVCASYKWLFGPYSLGLAYIADTLTEGRPLTESWMNRTNAKDFSNLTTYEPQYRPGAGRFNVGETSNFILMPIIREGLKQIEQWTVAGIQQYCEALSLPLREYLYKHGVALEDPQHTAAHILSLDTPAGTDPEKLKNNLTERKVIVSRRGEHLRVSVNVFNDESDVNELIQAISDA